MHIENVSFTKVLAKRAPGVAAHVQQVLVAAA